MSKPWSYSIGERGNRVTVFERTKGGTLYAKVWNPAARDGKGGMSWRSLEHRDKTAAKAYAKKLSGRLEADEEQIRVGRVTLKQLSALYEQYVTPTKKPRQQERDRARVELWTRQLGASKDVTKIGSGEWARVAAGRRSGAIDSRGRPVPEGDRRPVGKRAVEIDLRFLRSLCEWATGWKVNGKFLLAANPVRGGGFPIESERNPKRPVATDDRYERTLEVARKKTMRVRRNGSYTTEPCHLHNLLVIVAWTGRRIGAVVELRFSDLRLERTPDAPYGRIRWPDETDKMDREWYAPIAEPVRDVLDRIMKDRPGVGDGWLFPAPGDLSRPLNREVANHWLEAAERTAGLQPLRQGLWHPYRRRWNSARKHLPLADRATAGGWKDARTIIKCYEASDVDTLYKVISEPRPIREVR
jgi:integrase